MRIWIRDVKRKLQVSFMVKMVRLSRWIWRKLLSKNVKYSFAIEFMNDLEMNKYWVVNENEGRNKGRKMDYDNFMLETIENYYG